MQQIATEQDSDSGTVEVLGLPPEQSRALAALMTGSSVKDAAAIAGVSRSTLHRWLAHDFAFGGAYNRERAELCRAARTRILTLADKALDTVASAIEGGDVRASLEVLKATGILSPSAATVGSSDPELLGRQADYAEFLDSLVPGLGGPAP